MLSVKSWSYLLYSLLFLFGAACTEVIPNISVNGSLSGGIWIRDPITQTAQNLWILTKETDIETLKGYCRPEVSRLAVKASQTANEWIDVMSFAPSSEIRCAEEGTFTLRLPTSSGPFAFSSENDFESPLQIRGITSNKQASDWLIQMSYDADLPVLIVHSEANVIQAPGTVVFKYRLSRESSAALNWQILIHDYQTQDPSRFILSYPSSVSVAANATTDQMITLPLSNPTGVCNDETLILKTTELSGARISAEPAVRIIDERPSVSLSSGTLLEVAENLGTFRFEVLISEACQYPLKVGYTISEAPGQRFPTLGSDYSTLIPGNTFVADIPSSRTSFEVFSPMTVINDSIDEPEEFMSLSLNWAQDTDSFFLAISSPHNRSVVIVDDDASPLLNLSLPSSVSEIDGQFLAEFSIDRPTEKMMEFDFAIETGDSPSVQIDSDIRFGVNGSAYFPPLQTVVRVPITVMDDDLFEPLEENFRISVLAAEMVAQGVANSSHLMTASKIIDNEPTPALTIIGPTDLIEGDSASSYRLRSSVKIQEDVVISLTPFFGTADLSDLIGTPPTSLTLSAGFNDSLDFQMQALKESSGSESTEVFSLRAEMNLVRGGLIQSPLTQFSIFDVAAGATLTPFSITGVTGSGPTPDLIADHTLNYFPNLTSFQISWTASVGAETYDVEIRRTNDDSLVLGTTIPSASTSLTTGLPLSFNNLIAGERYRVLVTANHADGTTTLAATNMGFEFLVNRPPSLSRTEVHTAMGSSVTLALSPMGTTPHLGALDLDSDPISITNATVNSFAPHQVAWTNGTLQISGGWSDTFEGPGVSQIEISFKDARGWEVQQMLVVRSYIENSTWTGIASSFWSNPANWCGAVKADLSGCHPATMAPTNWNMGTVYINGEISLFDTIDIDTNVILNGEAELRVQNAVINVNTSASLARLDLRKSSEFNGGSQALTVGELKLGGSSEAEKSVFNSTSNILRLRSLNRTAVAQNFVEFNPNNGTVHFGPWLGKSQGDFNWGPTLTLHNLSYDFETQYYHQNLNSASEIIVLNQFRMNTSEATRLDVPVRFEGNNLFAGPHAPSDESEGTVLLSGQSYTISPLTVNGTAALHKLVIQDNATLSLGNGSSSRLVITRSLQHLGTGPSSLPNLNFIQRGYRNLEIDLRPDLIYSGVLIQKLSSSFGGDIDWSSSGAISKLIVQNLSMDQMRFSQIPDLIIRDELKWHNVNAGPILNLSGSTRNLEMFTNNSSSFSRVYLSGNSSSGGGFLWTLELSSPRDTLIEAEGLAKPNFNLNAGLDAGRVVIRGRVEFESYTQSNSLLQSVLIQSNTTLESELRLVSNPICTAAGTNFTLETYSPTFLGAPQRSAFFHPGTLVNPCRQQSQTFIGTLPPLGGL